MNPLADFDSWIERFTADWVRQNPQLATVTQYFGGLEQDALDRKLGLTGAFGTSYGRRSAEESAALARRGIEQLGRFDRRSLSSEQQVSAAILEWRLQDVIANAPFAQHRFIFTQMIGLHVGLVHFLTALHPIRNDRDAENYLARLGEMAARIDDGVAEAREAASKGLIPPRFILERTIEQLDHLIAGDISAHPLVAAFTARLQLLQSLAPDRIRQLSNAAAAEVVKSVVPAFRRVREMLSQQISHAGDDAGAWALPEGAVYYRRQLQTVGGTTLTPQEIHDLGLAEVNRIETEMETLLRGLGYSGGSIHERIVRLNSSLQPPADGDPRAEILAQLQVIIDDAEHRSKSNFNLVPKAPVTVRREPAFSEKTAAAHYSVPAPDGSLPGVYWVPLSDVGPNVPWLGIGMKSTAYHEAIPGHHFQLAIEQESSQLPRFRRLRAFGFDPPYGEGWALYAEHLAAENDWYEDDVPSRLGYLDSQLFRARRLVVDTGLHEFKWSRQQAIDYGITVAEVERYVTWPGQACAYMLGQRRLLAMRERARAALGARFSVKAFHDLVLSGGSMPLEVLDSRVDAWSAAV